jgi:hypothetical protein
MRESCIGRVRINKIASYGRGNEAKIELTFLEWIPPVCCIIGGVEGN